MAKECVNFKGGKCRLPVTDSNPSLAEIRERADGTGVFIDTTDPNTMKNFYGLCTSKTGT